MQLKRELTVADIVAFLSLICLIGGASITGSNRIATHEEKISELEKARLELKTDLSNRLDRIENNQNRLEAKIDEALKKGNR